MQVLRLAQTSKLVHDCVGYNYQLMNPLPPIQVSTQPGHGTKRGAADDEVENTTHISSHFKKLRLNNTRHQLSNDVRHLGVPVGNTDQRASSPSSVTAEDGDPDRMTDSPVPEPNPPTAALALPPSLSPKFTSARRLHAVGSDITGNIADAARSMRTIQAPPDTDDLVMAIDETPHRVYISNLADEIAQIEAEEEGSRPTTTIILPELDKEVSKVPQNVIRMQFDQLASSAGSGGGGRILGRSISGQPSSSPSPSPLPTNNSQALILYRDPTSISVPEAEDAVRKAIIQARKEAREKMKMKSAENRLHNNQDHRQMADTDSMDAARSSPLFGSGHRNAVQNMVADLYDEDAMDMDMEMDLG